MPYTARHLCRYFVICLSTIALVMILACKDDPTSPQSTSDPLALSLNRGSWTLASHPPHSSTPSGNAARAKLLWHNVVGGARATDVWELEARPGDGVVNTLRLIFRPRLKLVNHYSNRAVTDTIRTASWAGIMTYYTGIDTIPVQHFQMRIRGTHGRLHLDFGRINEDVNGDGALNNEDGCTNPSLKNNRLEQEEDLGLDERPDSLELGYNKMTNPDPDGDDWFCQGIGVCPLADCTDSSFNDPNGPMYYDFINGTEGNRLDPASKGKPDAEMLTQYDFTTFSSYFSYVIDLADTLSEHSFYVPPTNQAGWKTISIPLADTSAVDATVTDHPDIPPDWSLMTHVRVWFDADPSQMTSDTVEIAEWKFTKD